MLAGCRTPFAKAGTRLPRPRRPSTWPRPASASSWSAARSIPAWIGTVVMGQVIPSVKAPNLGREMVLGVGLPPGVPAPHREPRLRLRQRGHRGGGDRHPPGSRRGGHRGRRGEPLRRAHPAQQAHGAGAGGGLAGQEPGRAGRAPSPACACATSAPTRPPSPSRPRASRMGQSAEKMAKENGISREEQDQIALASATSNAAAAIDDGRLAAGDLRGARAARATRPRSPTDNLVRRDTSLEALAALPPVFDRNYGTVTAGNSSPLTDGAAAVLLMSEERARAEGYEPLAFIRSWAVAAVDPGGQLLMGPALAIPQGARARRACTLADMDLIEMHEAFAAQVASNIQALESETWAREKLGRAEPVGKVDRERLNVCGGSIAIGHPFGATGARITTTLANELDAAATRKLRPPLRLRAGRHGLRDGARAMSAGALAGVRVLDLTRYIPGPYCTHAAGRPGGGRGEGRGAARSAIPPARVPPRGGRGRARCTRALNRNKRSVAVDLRSEEGAAVVRAAGRAAPTCWSRPSARACSPAAASAPDELLRRQPAARLLLAHRLRPGRAARRAGRARHRLRWRSAASSAATATATAGRCCPRTQVADMTGGLARRRSASWPRCRRASAPGAARCVDVSLLDGALALHDAARWRARWPGGAARERADAAPTPATTSTAAATASTWRWARWSRSSGRRCATPSGWRDLVGAAVGRRHAPRARRSAAWPRAFADARPRRVGARARPPRRLRRAGARPRRGAGAGRTRRRAAGRRAAGGRARCCARWPRPSGSRRRPCAIRRDGPAPRASTRDEVLAEAGYAERTYPSCARRGWCLSDDACACPAAR